MKRMTILIADDEAEIADLVELHLAREGYRCIKATTGLEAVQTVQSQTVDLAILDIMMPGMDGYEVTRQIRETSAMPIIFLSAKTSDLDKITGLVIGADDYMTKPFNPMELVARVNAQLRRALHFNQQSGGSAAPVLEAGGLVIDPGRHTVTQFGHPVELTPKEFDILYLLASHPKKVFSAEHLFQSVWGEAYYESGNTVMVHIRTLRKKLGDDKNKWIKTVWGVGYTFNG
ncbi:response regulator transcription factor [Paenibacillus sp. MWE-103]|uniref:Response regulator transcription factor n=1 Tax=Paenibacillus artemisiicola TaxID=1172618 RepID=A0ABS3WEP0_9BACL|nr:MULTISPECIES: response regulator transcription factor [Paenibacillus]MBO7746783.1 response regulator transcription factor [Paenibacillus artemisiicola]SFJ22348.1 DNA-binding response regulator, OmpR family, contains REC and winged-helix (wHTH) domain [Paenibacillus sp. UNC496MF]